MYRQGLIQLILPGFIRSLVRGSTTTPAGQAMADTVIAIHFKINGNKIEVVTITVAG